MIERELLVLVWTLALHSDFITVLYLEQKMQGCNRSEGNNQNVKQKEKKMACKSNGLSGQIPTVFVRMLSRLLVTDLLDDLKNLLVLSSNGGENSAVCAKVFWGFFLSLKLSNSCSV